MSGRKGFPEAHRAPGGYRSDVGTGRGAAVHERGAEQDDDEPIRLDHDDVLDRLEAYRRRTQTVTEELVDLTMIETRADLVVLPEAEERTEG
jgi:hypothetical protein